MKASEEQIALFDRYLTGEMSAAERTYFEQSLSSDPNLVMAFNEYVAMAQALDKAGRIDLKNRFKAIAASVPDSDLRDYNPGSGLNTTRKDRYWSIMSWVMIIGSVLLLIAFLVAIMNLPDLEKKLKGETVPLIEKEVEQICGLYEVKPILLLESGTMRSDSADTVNDESVEIDSMGERYDTEITTRKIMVCQAEGEEVTLKLIQNQLEDTISIRGLLCEPIVYLKSNRPLAYIVSCGENTFVLDEQGFESYKTGSDTIAVNEELPLPIVRKTTHTEKSGSAPVDMEETTEYDVIAYADTSSVYRVSGTRKPVKKEDKVRGYTVMEGVVSFRVSGLTTNPGFKGNLDQWLKQNLVYPTDLAKTGKTGTSTVRFFLDYKGRILSPEIVTSLSPSCDKAILDALKIMPNWNPGYENSQPTGINVTMSIRFVKLP